PGVDFRRRSRSLGGEFRRLEALRYMSYPAYDPDRDTLAALADHMLGCAAIVSFLISEFSGGDFSELAPLDQDAVHSNVHMAICDSLTELGARHAPIDIATAATILHQALEA